MESCWAHDIKLVGFSQHSVLWGVRENERQDVVHNVVLLTSNPPINPHSKARIIDQQIAVGLRKFAPYIVWRHTNLLEDARLA